MHAMISQAAVAERTREMRAAAASERTARQARQVRRAGRTQAAGRVRRVLGQRRRISAAVRN
jgi:hypothetical protein